MPLTQKQTQDQEVQNGHAALAIKQSHGNKKVSVVIPMKHGFILNANTYNQIYSDSWMQAIYHGNACNVECKIFLPHFFNSSYTFETENKFSSLSKCSDLSSPGIPNATSSPKYDLNRCKNKTKNKTQKSKVKRPIRILNINFQSICNKNKNCKKL